jgi:uncharacterized protein (TIGR03083 family)
VNHATDFALAARAFVDLVGRIAPDQWEQPALGSWTVRGLVGHTSRAISTVANYLGTDPAPVVTVPDAETYYAEVLEKFTNNDAIAARGVEAGDQLGDDPQRHIAEALARTTALIAAESPGRIVAIGPLGIRLDEYLRTRVFELVVHSMDLGAATGLEHGMPASVVADTAALAARAAVLKGSGTDLLFALTGRGGLPQEFSIL